MPDEKIADLIERVERASGPDRELDGQIWCAVREPPLTFVTWDGAGCVYRGRDGIGHISCWNIPEWSRSLDAVLSLVERVRPGWGWQVNGGSLAKVATLMDDDSWSAPFEGYAATPPLAVLSALLRSIQG